MRTFGRKERAAESRRRKFTVEEYLRMGEAGILHGDDRVELIEGDILETAAIGNRHLACVNRLNRIFTERLGRATIVHVQNPEQISDHSDPEPDIALLRPRQDFYAGKRPTPEDVLLLVEVSDTTLEFDRDVKVPLYARTGVPEVWIVNLRDKEILRYSRPEGGSYKEVGHLDSGVVSISPRLLPELTVGIDDVFGQI